MKKLIAKKKSALIAATVLSMFASHPVDAANLGAFVASDYSQSQLGTVQGSYINSSDIKAVAGTLVDLNRDPAIYNTVDQTTGKSEMYIRQYNYSTTNLVPSYVFNGQGDFKQAVSGLAEGACNAHGVARSNNFVYVASYDEGTIGVGQVTDKAITPKTKMTRDLKQDLIDFEEIEFADTCQLHGEAVIIDGNNLYVIANVNPGGDAWDPSAAYDPSYLMQYIIQENGSLEYNSMVTMGKNTDSVRLNKYNNMIITTAIGGYQNYGDDVANKETSLNIAFLNANGKLTESKKVVIPNNVSREMRSLKVLPNGTAYVMCYNIANYGSAVNLDVYKTTVSNLASEKPKEWEKVYEVVEADGWFGRLDAEYDTNRLWLQVGNELNIFTDGETDPVTFGAGDFTTNPAYNQLYTWDIIKTDQVTGKLAKLREDSENVTNTEVAWKDITSKTQTTQFKSKMLSTELYVSDSEYVNLTNNILAAIQPESSSLAITKLVNVQVENDVATPVGIYVAPDMNVELRATKGFNIITKSPENGNSLTNAIWLDPSDKGGSSLTIVAGNKRTTGDLNIRVDGGMGGNGIAIAKTDRWGEDSKEAVKTSKIHVEYGNVNIKGETNQDWGIGLRKDNVISRYNNTGIITKVEKGEIIVDGNVDIDVYGNGIATVADDSKITIKGGGQITVPKGTVYGYYALATYGGDVAMNLGADGKTAGANDVKIDGDIFVIKRDNPEDASVSLALTTADSFLNGIIDNGSTANLYLQNGAVWTNEANNARYYQDSEDVGNGEKSRVTNFHGGNKIDAVGVIRQTANSKNLTIDKYSGHAMVMYTHDAEAPTNILGGDTTIIKATKGSTITLRTDNNGIDTSETDTVNAVLDALAHKLYYTDYVNGERRLYGYVQIAEGLTTAAVTKAAGYIQFSETNGQGSYTDVKVDYGDIDDGDDSEDEDIIIVPKTTFTTEIFGDAQYDTEYAEEGIIAEDGKYVFARNITINTSSPFTSETGDKYYGSITNYDCNDYNVEGTGNTHIDMNGNNLTINTTVVQTGTEPKTHGAGIYAVKQGDIIIDNPGAININSNVSYCYGAGIKAGTAAKDQIARVIINNDNTTAHAVKIRGGMTSGDDNAMNFSGINTNNNNEVHIKGLADIETNKAVNMWANGGLIDIGGGNFTANNYAAIWATEGGTVNINMTKDADGNMGAGTNKVVLKGDIQGTTPLGGNGGNVNVAFVTGNSSFDGAATEGSNNNIWLQNGAHWNNTGASVLTNFYGDNVNTGNATAGSYILQNSENASLAFDNYSGDTTIIYKRDAETPTNIIGGNVTIKSAAENSTITLRTDNSGLYLGENERTTVEGVLNALANKLFYTGYVTGEKNLNGVVEIAEGLTASAISRVYGNIKYSETDGQGSLDGSAEGLIPLSQNKDSLTASIYGTEAQDGDYVYAGILKDGVYEFVKDKTTITVENSKEIAGGPWMSNLGTAVSAVGAGKKTIINLNDNDLVINETARAGSTGIAAINDAVVEINTPGDITINATGGGQTAAVYANGSGEVHIHNGEKGILRVRANTPNATNCAVIKTMNGKKGESKIIIDGMVDVLADYTTGSNEAISAVASRIEIGGGNIVAQNGAWAAIRAYGEFVSSNAGIVNINVTKDENGNANGVGNRKTTIIGDFVTNGGMGSKGYISVGLNGKESYWEGNYADNVGYGVTPGQLGNVNIWVEDGAHWKGFANGAVNLTLSGKDSYWYGFNTSEKMLLALNDGAVWQNAITTEQTNGSGAVVDSRVGTFMGDGGFIDMTGAKVFVASGSSLNGESVSSANTAIKETVNGVTGDLVIDKYSGNTTVIYKHDATTPTNIIGGDVTVKSATENSVITLRTDNAGINTGDSEQVDAVFGSLAKKLYYTAYVNGTAENGSVITGERNLHGKVEIAEGLTASSAAKVFNSGDIKFSTKTGQGSYGVLDDSEDEGGDNTGGDNTGGDNTGGDNTGGDNTGGDNTDDGEQDKPQDKPIVPEDKPVAPEKVEVKIELESGITGEGGEINFCDKEDENGNEADRVVVEIKESTTNNDDNSAIIGTSGKPVVIEMGGKDLTIVTSARGDGSVANGIQAKDADVTINNVGNITIKASATGNGGVASAIFANGNNVVIDNAKNKGTVELKADSNVEGVAVLHAENDANVNITGKVNITDTKGNTAINVGAGSTVAIGGGEIDAGKDGTAIVITGEDSKVIANTDNKGESKKNGLKIKGNIQIGEVPASTFNLRRSIMLLASGNKPYGEFTFDGVEDTWEGDYIGANDTTLVLALKNGATWTGAKESNGVLDLTIESNGTWKNTSDKATTVTTLSGEGGFVEMSEGDLAISAYNGKTTFVYAHNYGKDVKDEDLIKGGDVTITAVTGNSNIATMRTNNIGTSDKGEVDRVLKALAEKLAYTGYASNKDALTGKVQIMEGMTGSSVTREGQIKFDDTTGKGSLDTKAEVKVEYKGDYIYGDSETAMMKGAKSAMASTVMMWRSESNDLLQRMGDVRLATEESGVWAKYYGGKYEMDAQNTNFSTNYKAYQVGYDKAVGNGWNVGVAVSHNEGDSRYDRGGEGEMTVTSLSVYGNKDYGDGRYLGLILKGSQLKNEYEVFNNDGYKLEGDFKTWGTSISAEYGKRIEKGNGFYFDPSVELTVGHVQGKDYTATSDMLAAYGKTATMQVEQDDFNSIIGRVGFGIGQRTDKASYYAKLALAHEFGGDFDTNYTAEETKGTNIDFGDTWYEMQLGGTAKLSDNSLLYATYERSFGGDVTEKWRVDAGLRVTF